MFCIHTYIYLYQLSHLKSDTFIIPHFRKQKRSRTTPATYTAARLRNDRRKKPLCVYAKASKSGIHF